MKHFFQIFGERFIQQNVTLTGGEAKDTTRKKTR